MLGFRVRSGRGGGHPPLLKQDAGGPSSLSRLFQCAGACKSSASGPVEFSKPYVLKHVATGQYLGLTGLVKDHEKDKGRKLEWRMSSKREEGTRSDLFMFVPIDQTSQSCVVPNSFFVIQHVRCCWGRFPVVACMPIFAEGTT